MSKLGKNNLKDKFDLIITKDDVLRGKPAPDVYLEAIKRFNLQENQCLAVEDTEPGLESATNKLELFVLLFLLSFL